MNRYKNNHVSPTEIEDILQKHDAVSECLVYGKPDDRVQELISAVVILKPGHQVPLVTGIFYLIDMTL